MNDKIKKQTMRILKTIIGVIIVSISIKFFLAPNKIAAGGISGIAIILNNFFSNIPVGAFMLVMDMGLFLIAFIILGKNFGGISLFASISLAGFTWVLDYIFPYNVALTNDLLLATIFGTIISGIGMGIVFNQNASTGGTDIIAKIINKYLHIDMGKSLLMVDLIVTIVAGITLGFDQGLVAVLGVILNGSIIDKTIEGLNISKQIIIVSKEKIKIKEFILKDLDRGCTIISAKGGYTGKETELIYTVLGRKELIKLKEYVREIDRYAFINVSDSHEVLGEGFKNLLEE
ncbi:YitT family protein [Clostridium cellulovorans]|uniref:DUF2179 domain-containing protein n=1 Tax=Clostridium cellulovorans (strain ATCC 35296 / DSM 3052 / OCM 3 / 743B) TaxID=573061 RepID=D9SUX0_CLOC7|nr:YitT family protein [Clostridium cellulovorans]ADL51025.1 Protein of unknown function DUF2179 [Clostridium cellulovorans 743B]